MTQLTNEEIDLLLEQPHESKLWLSIYQPVTVFQAQVNDPTIGKSEREITYNLLSFGSHLLVAENFVMYVGSSAGAFDKGRIRVRSITDSVATVAENDHINWSDEDHLTVVQYIINEAVFPRIIKDPNDDEDVIFYKDYDIAYTDQNSVLGTFINMGSHYAGLLENGSHDIYYSSSGTENLRGEALAYEWFFQGADSTGSNSADPGNISYSTPGHYFTRLITSGTSIGAIDTSYRWISVYDNPSDGETIPIMNFEMDGLSGNRLSGGYTGAIRIREPVPESLVKSDSLVVVFADDWYGATKQSIGGNQLNREKIVFSGYVMDGTIQYDFDNSFVEFEIASLNEMVKQKEGFSISVEDSNNPSKWFQLLHMTPKKAIYHFLRWQSTILQTTDVRFKGSEFDRSMQYYDADRSSLYDATYALVSTGLLGVQVSDRQGTTWFEIDPPISQDNPNLASLDIQNRIWMGEPDITERNFKDLSYIELNGIAYVSGSTGSSSALLSGAPGEAPAYVGSDDLISGLVLTGQTDLNILSGDYWAMINAKYPENVFTLQGNFRNYDIAPLETMGIIDPVNGSVRQFTFDGIQFYITSMSWTYDPEQGVLFPVVTLAEVTNGFPGTTIIIPVEPPTTGFNNVPPFDLPPLPPFPPLPGVSGIELLDEGVSLGIVTSLNFIGGSVVAVKNSETGEITYTCNFAGINSEFGIIRENVGGGGWTAAEKLAQKILHSDTGIYTSGVTYSAANHRFTVSLAGTYQVNITGRLSLLSSDLINFPSQYVYNKYTVKQFSSGGASKKEWTAEGSPASTVVNDDPPILVGSILNDAATTLTASAQCEAGDYFEFYAEGIPKLAILAADIHNVSIYRI